MRLSWMLRDAGDTAGHPAPARRALLWVLVALAILAGIVLYFRYGRTLTPLIG